MPRVSGEAVRAELAWAAQGPAYVAALAWRPDGAWLAAGDDDGGVALFDGVSGPWGEALGHDGGTLCLDWSARGVLASGGRDGTVVLGGTRCDAQRGWVERVAWRPDGARLAVAQGRRVTFRDESGYPVDVSGDLPATVSCLAWHPRGVLCAAGTYGGVRMLRGNGAVGVDHLAWTGSVLELAFSPDGRYLAHGNQDSSVHFWDMRKRSELEMTGYATKVRQLAWSPDRRWLATGGGADAICWDFARRGGPRGSRPARLERHEGRITALAFQPEGGLLASIGEDGVVALWRVGEDDLPLGGVALDEPLSVLAWAPDGRRLAVGGAHGGVAMVDVDADG